ncbi:hypothetical protein Tco_0574973, partial [Tanacetum coccineum]
MSFDMPASPEYLSSLARASLAEIFKLQFFSESFEGDYTSSCPPSLVLSSYLISARLKCLAIDVMLLRTWPFCSSIFTLSAAVYFAPDSFLFRLEDFVMSELLDDAIGVYHRIFDFSGVRIPFSFFLLVIIKHYKVHFTQHGPLGLNKTLFKQGDWFSFVKRHASSLVCIDDNSSYMNHWKSGFFLIDQMAIHDYMTWRHPDSAIDDPKPIAGSYRMADVRCLSAHVVKLRDMPEGALVFFGLSRVWKSRTCDPVLRGADGNVMGIHDFL